jgi:hypothetical protein
MVTLINCISIRDPWGHVETSCEVELSLFCMPMCTVGAGECGYLRVIGIRRKFSFFALFRFNHTRTSDLDTEYHPQAYSFPHTTN